MSKRLTRPELNNILRSLTTTCIALCVCTSAQAGIPVPAYSSRPGAAYTFYLDFGGFTYSSGWGGLGTPGTFQPYSTDVNTSAFSATEQLNIQKMWSEAAEQFAAFDINVTTVDPATSGLTDTQRQAYYDSTAGMMHTVIGQSSWINATGVTHGNAKVGFSQSNGNHLNFVFTNHLGNVNSYIARIIAHEDGHGLRLDHQSDYTDHLIVEYSDGTGSGSGSIAPNMGYVYNAQRVLWAKGTDYYGNTQNDVGFFTSASLNPNLSIIDDGVGHTKQTATALTIVNNTVEWSSSVGIITPNPDDTTPTPTGPTHYSKDYWSFTTDGGLVTLTANSGRSTVTPGTADVGKTLDAALVILDSDGNVLYSSTYVAGQLDATLSVNLAAGDYYALVTSTDGLNSTGLFDNSYTPREFYDIGSYFLTGTIPFTEVIPEPASLGLLILGMAILLLHRSRNPQNA